MDRINLTCAGCSRHASYIARMEPPRDMTLGPRI
jgi:hypothetical protein